MKRKHSLPHEVETVRIVRTKIVDTDAENLSVSSTTAISQQSIGIATPSTATEYSSEESSDSESDSGDDSSSLSSSSDEETDSDELDSDASSSEEEELEEQEITIGSRGQTTLYTDPTSGITTVRIGNKPVIDRSAFLSSSVLARLQKFIPKMVEANNVLDQERITGDLGKRMLEVDNDEVMGEGQVIEMNLGLGVLEEKKDGDQSADEDEEMGDDLLTTLMGKPRSADVGIQEVGDN